MQEFLKINMMGWVLQKFHTLYPWTKNINTCKLNKIKPFCIENDTKGFLSVYSSTFLSYIIPAPMSINADNKTIISIADRNTDTRFAGICSGGIKSKF